MQKLDVRLVTASATLTSLRLLVEGCLLKHTRYNKFRLQSWYLCIGDISLNLGHTFSTWSPDQQKHFNLLLPIDAKLALFGSGLVELRTNFCFLVSISISIFRTI